MGDIVLIKKKQWYETDIFTYGAFVLKTFGIYNEDEYRSKLIHSILYVINKHRYIFNTVTRNDGISTLLNDPENEYIIDDIYRNTGIHFGRMSSLVDLFTITGLWGHIPANDKIDTALVIHTLDVYLKLDIVNIDKYSSFKHIFSMQTSIHRMYDTANTNNSVFFKINKESIVPLILPEDVKPYMGIKFYDGIKRAGKVFVQPYINLEDIYNLTDIESLRKNHIEAVKFMIKENVNIMVNYDDDKITVAQLKDINLFMINNLCDGFVIDDIKETLRNSKIIYKVLYFMKSYIKNIIYNIIISSFIFLLIYGFYLKHLN